MVETTYTLTEDEYVEAQVILLRVVQKKFMRMRIWLSCILVAALLEPLIARTATWQMYGDTRMIFVVILLLILVFLPWIQARAARKQFEKVKGTFTNFKLRLDENGYSGECPGVANGNMNWVGFTDWREGKTVFALLRHNIMYSVPKRGLTAEQITEVRSMLETHITTKSH